jgi:hypothetical protein
LHKSKLLFLALLSVPCSLIVVHFLSRETSSQPDERQTQTIAPVVASPLSAPMKELASPQSEAARAMERTLAACHPHLQSTPIPVPQIDINGVGDPGAQRIKIRITVSDDGGVTQETISEATFGLPSEQRALLNYARNLTFLVPQNESCRNLETEIIGEAFERRDRLGRWATQIRLYPKYSFDSQGNLQLRQ